MEALQKQIVEAIRNGLFVQFVRPDGMNGYGLALNVEMAGEMVAPFHNIPVNSPDGPVLLIHVYKHVEIGYVPTGEYQGIQWKALTVRDDLIGEIRDPSNEWPFVEGVVHQSFKMSFAVLDEHIPAGASDAV